MYWEMIKVITLNLNEWILQIKIWFFNLQLLIALWNNQYRMGIW